MEKTIVVSNTSPLINLGSVDALYLIPLLFSYEEYEVVVPPEVIEEINSPLDNQIKDMQAKGQIIIPQSFISSVISNVATIAAEIAMNGNTWNPKQHYTEAYVIVQGMIAKTTRGAAFVLIDEKVAKTIAKQKGLRAMNHLDIIRECVKEEILTPTDGLEIIEKLISKGVKYKSGMIEHYRTIWS